MTSGAVERAITAVCERRPVITVFGDLVLDDWWLGSSERLSREAPVPVVDASGHRLSPGGAANAAVALAALRCRVRLVGVVGDDEAADVLLGALTDAHVDVSGVVRDAAVTTTRKTRVLAGDAVVVRVDEAGAGAHSDEALARLRQVIGEAASDPTVPQLICDYGLGTGETLRSALLDAPRPGLRVVDAHELALWAALEPDVVTPNDGETRALLGDTGAPQGDRAEALLHVRERLFEASGARVVVATLDRDGSLTLARDGAEPHRTRAVPAPDHYATGAGDSFTAALTAAMAAGIALADAADLAQAAADVVVRKPGTASCAADELLRGGGVLRSREEIAGYVSAQKAAGRRVVFTNGCFDVLHRGHVASLSEARELGDVLVVALNSDDSTRRLKGPSRPINPFEDRAAVLAGLDSVDAVTEFDESTPVALIASLEPDVYVKGGDYAEEMLEEAAIVRAYGGEVRMLQYVADHSTTELVERIRGPERTPTRRSSARWAETELDPGTLDVLIPSCDRPAELAVTLSGLAAQDDPAFRVLISDQSTGAPGYEHPAAAAMIRVLEAEGHPVLVEQHLPRRGLAEQRHHLLERSIGTAPDATEVLYLDDDVWLEPRQLAALVQALRERRAGFMGAAVQGLSYLDDERPHELERFAPWPGPVAPERVDEDPAALERWRLHNAANLVHLAGRLRLGSDEKVAYKVAWVGGCVLYDRAALIDAGGFDFWRVLPPEHAGEDVVAQWRVMARVGGAGLLPSGAVHLEAPTTVVDRTVNATERIVVMTDMPNPIQVQKFLGGLDYPVDKSTIVERARTSGADEPVLDVLQDIADREYETPTEVSEELARSH